MVRGTGGSCFSQWRQDDGVQIYDGAIFTAGTPQALFEGRYLFGPNSVAAYDVAADGQRFLPSNRCIRSTRGSDSGGAELTEELKRLVPAN